MIEGETRYWDRELDAYHNIMGFYDSEECRDYLSDAIDFIEYNSEDIPEELQDLYVKVIEDNAVTDTLNLLKQWDINGSEEYVENLTELLEG